MKIYKPQLLQRFCTVYRVFTQLTGALLQTELPLR